MSKSRSVPTGSTTASTTGLTIERRFTRPGVHPFDEVEWELRSATITNEKGEKVFEQTDVEIPKSWSQMATNVVVSKYFRGQVGKPEREKSVKQLIGRVVDTISGWGREQGYFASPADAEAFEHELAYLLVTQRMAFNSPVWFNVGVEAKPQGSACFINSIDDTMDSILTLAKTEGMLFKYGSGAGVNLSPLRGSMEKLKQGGTASGPVSFMRGFDAFAGAIKSGGATRRAAKMVILNVDHPDIEEFINCKVNEERKAWALIDAGYDGAYTGEAYGSVFFQNSNNSVRVPDEFMKSVENDGDWTTKFVSDGGVHQTFKARDLMRQISDAAWICGDPGMQYDTTIQDWNCVANTAKINATNPCSEFVFIDDTACNLASINLLHFLDDQGKFMVDDFKHAVRITISAQEMIVPNASYPTPQIEVNSHKLRPLGLGYANLGALLMSLGLPYDSDEGRAYGAAVTSLMTGEAYAQSARISAAHGGPFELFEHNREPMLKVMNKHRDASYAIDRKIGEAGLAAAACESWDEAVALGVKHGYRNAQATVLAPTGCLTGSSLVMTDRGLVRLRSLGDPNGEKWQDLDARVATDDGPREATKFFVNGVEPVVTVETKRGYRIQGTPTHRVKVVDAAGEWTWRHLADVRPDDRVPLMLGGMVGAPRTVDLPPLAEACWTSDNQTFVPRKMTAELAELVGYFMGDGSLHSRGLRFCVAQSDRDVVDRLVELGRSLFGLEAHVAEKQGYTEVALHSVRLTLWWEACGFAKTSPAPDHRGKGYSAHIPDAILGANDPAVYGAFLRGLFESDGTVSSGYVSFTTTTEQFARDVQAMMLALGLITTLERQAAGSGWGSNEKFRLRLLNLAASAPFAERIGFMSERKSVLGAAHVSRQAARADKIPVPRSMVDMLAPENDSLRKTMLLALSREGMVSRRSAVALMERGGTDELGELLGFFYDEVATAELGEEEMTYDLSVPDNVTYVANGFVSHNTIAFMMDCDTTGVEPDIALVKYKKLVGGGLLKIVNNTVPRALKKLGYGDAAVKKIIDFIAENDTIEGAPGLKDEHLAVFDCAFKAQKGERSIHYMGHLKMVAATQPFVSGSISKTINLPETATVDDIEQAYIDGWKMGLKCISVYRDNCKRSQPLNTGLDAKKLAPKQVVVSPTPVRRKLPDERTSITHKFDIQGHEGYITVGMFQDGSPGEIFVKMAKEGSTLSGMMDSFAIMVSLSLQYGVPLEALVSKFSHVRFEPSGYTSNKEIPIAKSIVDYIFRWLASKFYDDEAKEAIGIIRREPKPEPVAEAAPAPAPKAAEQPKTEAKPEQSSGSDSGEELRVLAAGVGGVQAKVTVNLTDSMTCSDCGAIMVRAGACYKCLNCGTTSGCG
ncbi:MAG: ribonucleoside-diphosphate reductase alpha chain [Chloroflexota bacterium]|nr:ribonucleoside-diphosphate reductase alpha chain [Chloroflexota bacterium]